LKGYLSFSALQTFDFFARRKDFCVSTSGNFVSTFEKREPPMHADKSKASDDCEINENESMCVLMPSRPSLSACIGVYLRFPFFVVFVFFRTLARRKEIERLQYS